MGVKDLWQLLSAVGRRISIETLETKVLAIDVSIWITQFIKAMRDEDGKTIHNAHLIGTIRRILKLLYHRIRPVFVFDGVAPSIKQRTLRRRQTFRDNQDGNYKKLGQKLLMSRLKQEAIRAELTEARTVAHEDGQFASSFVPPARERGEPSSSSADRSQPPVDPPSAAAGGQGADMEWEDGYTDIGGGKSLNTGRDNDDDSVQSEEMEWDLPMSADDIDVAVLASLPTQMRKDLIEAARRRERARRRSHYLPVAANPDLYSQTQIANFLRTSKFNQRIIEVQDASLNPDGGSRIAAQGNKKFVFRSGQNTAQVPPEPVVAPPERSEEVAFSKSSFFPDSSDDDEETGYGVRALQSGSTFYRNESSAATSSQAVDLITRSSPTRGQDIFSQTPTVSSAEVSVIDLSDQGAAAVSNHSVAISSEFVDLTNICSGASPNNTYSYTQDPIPVAGEGEDDYEDVEWESGLSTDESDVEVTVAPQDGIYDNDDASASRDVNVSAERSAKPVVMSSLSSFGLGDAAVTSTSDSADLPLEQHTTKPFNASSLDEEDISNAPQSRVAADSAERSVLEHAVATASMMNDWAGREMQKFLKSHMKVGTGQGVDTLLDERSEDVNNVANRDSSSANNFLFSEQKGEVSVGTSAEEADVPKHTSPRLNDKDLSTILHAEAEQQRADVEKSRAYQRDAAVLTSEMKEEVMELLDAFDVPYIVAPSEAEAQCAILERLGLVDGIVTDDSDSFLFGAKSVYKNIFHDGKYVEAYLLKDIELELGLDQASLIAMAYLLGSDYTDGVKGIGIVNSMEIIQAFMRSPGQETATGCPVVTSHNLFYECTTQADRIMSSLQSFKKWVDKYALDVISDGKQKIESEEPAGNNSVETSVELGAEYARKRKRRSSFETPLGEDGMENDPPKCAGLREEAKLREFGENHKTSRSRWFLPALFPERAVCDAYLRPDVNTSTQSFFWPVPELARVSRFCKDRLGWTEAEISDKVAPVISKCLEPQQTQSTLDQYVTRYQDNAKFAAIKSKRLQTVLSGQAHGGKKKAKPVQKRKRKKRGDNSDDSACSDDILAS